MWRPVGLSGVVATATSSTSKHPFNDKWACSRSLFPTVAVCGARRCLAPRIRGTAATFFRPWARGRQATSEPSSATRGRWSTNTQLWQLLRSRWRVGAPVVFQDRVQQGGAARPQRRGGHARFVLRVQTPMRATARVNDPAPVRVRWMRGGVAGPGPWRYRYASQGQTKLLVLRPN